MIYTIGPDDRIYAIYGYMAGGHENFVKVWEIKGPDDCIFWRSGALMTGSNGGSGALMTGEKRLSGALMTECSLYLVAYMRIVLLRS